MSYFLEETLQQPDAIRSTIRSFNANPMRDVAKRLVQQAEVVIFTGMGSSLAAAHYGAQLLLRQGRRALALDASELLYYQQSLLNDRTVLIIISQSGCSAEICKLLAVVEGKLPIVGITNTSQSPLSCHSTAPLLLKCGLERAASTKTYTSTLALLYLFAAWLNDDDATKPLIVTTKYLEAQIPSWMKQAADISQQFQDIELAVCMGRGMAYSTASSSSLLLQEVAKLPAFAIPTGQFRHGPIEALSPKCGYIMIQENETSLLDLKLAQILRSSHQARNFLWIGQTAPENTPLLASCTCHDWLNPLVNIIPIQLLVGQLGSLRGLNPDGYCFGAKVTLED